MNREKKTVEICVRVTPAEKKELQEKADAAHLSLSRYLVKSASDRKMLQTENIAKLIYEIRKIGINVNQIAHVANGQRFILQSDLVSLNRHMDAVIEITKKIFKATYDEKEANIKTLERKIDIHNHLLINSVSLETGSKWLGNQTTLKNLREQSDKLCRQYNFAINGYF